MWTKEHRARVLAWAKGKRYTSNLTDEEWGAIAPLLPPPARTGRRRKVDLREVMNAIRYLMRTGCEWRMLPHEFSAWQTVYWRFRRFVRRFLFRLIHDIAVMTDRERIGRNSEPSAGVLDSQTIKSSFAKRRGCDTGKRINGRKQHIAVDTDGRLLMVNMTSADIADSVDARMVLEAIRLRWPWVKHLFADSAYDRAMLMDKAVVLDFIIEVVRKLHDQHTFVPLPWPRRWAVERTFGWMIHWRRLVRDFERRIDVSER